MTTTPAPDSSTEVVMEDFVFGGIEAEQATLLTTERRRHTGLRHRYALTPRDPLPGEAVTVTVYSGPDIQIDCVSLYVTTDGREPVGRRARGHRLYCQPGRGGCPVGAAPMGLCHRLARCAAGPVGGRLCSIYR
ncbi:MAG: hypothetical protein R3E79_40740 [Caldilineaceae bacterium]